MTVAAASPAKTQADQVHQAKRRRRLTRQLWLTFHVLFSVSWHGVALAQLTLAVTAWVDSDVSHSAFELMHVFDMALNIPLAILTLVTGVVVSLRGRWGLLLHWWVVAKLVLTVFAVLFAGAYMRTVIERADHATADGSGLGDGRATAVIVGACLMNVLFITATFLSTLKPWGMTGRGRRNAAQQAAERAAASGRPARRTSAPSGTAMGPVTDRRSGAAPGDAPAIDTADTVDR